MTLRGSPDVCTKHILLNIMTCASLLPILCSLFADGTRPRWSNSRIHWLHTLALFASSLLACQRPWLLAILMGASASGTFLDQVPQHAWEAPAPPAHSTASPCLPSFFIRHHLGRVVGELDIRSAFLGWKKPR